jgi:nucleotide-binding universal stress UspA family protein
VPVLVVPRQPRRTDAERLHERMLGAIELRAHDRGDARRLAAVARMLGQPLTLVHVVPLLPAPYWLAARLNPDDRRRLTAAQARLNSLALTVRGKGRVVIGRAEEEIPAVASDIQASIIAVVLRAGRGLFGARQGSTTYRVLGGTRLPVLALPPRARA